MDTITSTKNERVKQWAELKTPKGRKVQSKYIIEGIKSVEEALGSFAPIEVILVDEQADGSGKLDQVMNLAASAGIECLSVTSPVIEKVADTITPQRVIAIARQFQHDLAGILQNQTEGLFLLVDRINDPGNLGTLIRTADAMGAAGVLVGKGSSDIYNPKVVRSTMGSLFHLPVMEGDLSNGIQLLKDKGYKIVGTSASGKAAFFQTDLSGKVGIVIGSESHGIDEAIMEMTDQMVSIPMPGKAESLNAAVAGSLLLYEALRQRL